MWPRSRLPARLRRDTDPAAVAMALGIGELLAIGTWCAGAGWTSLFAVPTCVALYLAAASLPAVRVGAKSAD